MRDQATEYIGCVPTITGNLSFSVIGTGKQPKKLYKSYWTRGRAKFTLSVQQRYTSDRITVSANPSGRFVFAFLGYSHLESQHDKNSGSVFIINHAEFWRYRYLFDHLEAGKSAEEFQDRFLSTVAALRTPYGRRYLVELSVTLERSGKIVISFDPNEFSEDERGTVANQAYYFMRDISHVHQHHEPSSDTILKVYPDGDLRNSENSNWKRETLYALHKFIIQQKRTRRLEALVRCKGVLAYAEAFEKLHVKRVQNGSSIDSSEQSDGNSIELDDVPTYIYTTVEASLRAAIDEARGRTTSDLSSLLATRVLPLLISAFSIIAAFVFSSDFLEIDEATSQQRWMIHASEFLISYPFLPFVLPLVPIVAWKYDRFVQQRMFPLRFVRDIQRLLIGYGYLTSIFATGLLFSILLTLTVLFSVLYFSS